MIISVSRLLAHFTGSLAHSANPSHSSSQKKRRNFGRNMGGFWEEFGRKYGMFNYLVLHCSNIIPKFI